MRRSATNPPDMYTTLTYINAGGPFVQLNNPQSSFVMEMKSLKDLTPVQLDGGAIDYGITVLTRNQTATATVNFKIENVQFF